MGVGGGVGWGGVGGGGYKGPSSPPRFSMLSMLSVQGVSTTKPAGRASLGPRLHALSVHVLNIPSVHGPRLLFSSYLRTVQDRMPAKCPHECIYL